MNYKLRIISYLCTKFNDFMKKVAPFIGIILIVLGALLLISTRWQLLANANWPLYTGLLLITIGIILHIRSIKRESHY